MVNHYASLLLNLAGEKYVSENKSYFTGYDYSPIELPLALQQFYYSLFPRESSFYYKQFLCYCFLRILDSVNMYSDVIKYDPRVTYDLDDLKEYFRLNRISSPTTSNFAFNLVVLGKYEIKQSNNYYFNSYTVEQNEFLPEVYVYSDVDKVFLKNEKQSAIKSDDMRIPLFIAPTKGSTPASMTQSVPVGNTGLSFVLTGNFSSLPGEGKFTQTANKYWNFIVESPFTFEFIEFFNQLTRKESSIARMINYGEAKTPTNLNIWMNHFNEAYRFAGLLNMFIEKVNTEWLKQQM